MSFVRIRSIKFRVTLWYAATLTLLSVALSAFLYYRLQNDIVKQYDRFVRSYASDIGGHAIENYPDTQKMRAAVMDEIRALQPAVLEYRLFDAHGQPVLSSSDWGPEHAACPGSGNPNPMTIHIEGHSAPYRVSTRDLQMPGGPRLIEQAAVSLRYPQKALRNYWRNLLALLAPLLTAGTIGGYFLVRRSLTPALQMTHRARDIFVSGRKERLEVRESEDELNGLAVALNEMLDRIEEAFDRIEEFSTDLAHELRTPMTLLIGETEAALLANPSAAELRALLERHAEVYQRLRNMSTDLLSLLRAGTASALGRFELHDLTKIVDDVVERFSAVGEEKGVEVRWERAEVGSLVCDRQAIARMLSNLVDNAIRHTEAGGVVSLGLTARESDVVFSVGDTGEGMSEADVERAFERFFRGCGARAEPGTGFGLGLAIVQDVARRHGGSARIRSRLGEGTTVLVELPRGAHAGGGGVRPLASTPSS